MEICAGAADFCHCGAPDTKNKGVRLIKRIEQLSLSVELYKGAANATP